MSAIVILRNRCRAWTMYLHMESVKFLLGFFVGGATILWQLADPFEGGRFY